MVNIKQTKANQITFVIAFLLFVSTNIFAQTITPTQTLAAKVDEYMNAALKVDRFSGSILAARDGKMLVAKGYGMANLETGTPNTLQTKFRLGSIGKQFTAMAIMMLAERGKLKTSDSVCKYLSDCPAAWQPVTLRHLLSHTAGAPELEHWLPEFSALAFTGATPDALAKLIKDKPLDFAPGEKWSYSNSGYNLLGLVIERVSGKTYEEFLQENIFRPLRMTNTGIDSFERVIKNRASGYYYDPTSDAFTNAEYINMSLIFAAGSIYSTVEDLLLWENALDEKRFISPQSYDEMFAPIKSDYAYGSGISRQFDQTAISNTGVINGFRASMRRYPADRVTVVVLGNVNKAKAASITTDLAAIIFGKPYQVPQKRKILAVNSAVIDSYVGTYRVDENFSVVVTNENGTLTAAIGGLPKMSFSAGSEIDFFSDDFDIRLKFIRNDAGQITQLKGAGLWWAEFTAAKIK